MMNNLQCPFCKHDTLRFNERQSSPIFITVNGFIFNLQTTLCKRKMILKCNNCGYEAKDHQ